MDGTALLGINWGSPSQLGLPKRPDGMLGMACFAEPGHPVLGGVTVDAVLACYEQNQRAWVLATFNPLDAPVLVKGLLAWGGIVRNPDREKEVYWCGRDVAAGLFLEDDITYVLLENYRLMSLAVTRASTSPP